LLRDGTVLVTGFNYSGDFGGAAEIFDPKNGTFSPTGPITNGADENTATPLLNGTVLFVGNEENDGFPGDAEIYDPTAGTFTFIGFTHAPHEFSAAARLRDGTVLIVGGQLPGGNGSRGADLYVPATGTFDVAGNMVTGRHSTTATLLPDGTVLIAGGYSTWPNPTPSAEIYSPANSGTQRVNVAAHSNGGVATASSTYSANYPASAVNDGDRRGLNPGAGGYWNDATANVFPDSVQISFSGSQTITEIDVFAPQARGTVWESRYCPRILPDTRDTEPVNKNETASYRV